MAGPNSVPAGDKQLFFQLQEMLCHAHTTSLKEEKICYGEKGTEKSPCRFATRREWLIARNRLVTGKTR